VIPLCDHLGHDGVVTEADWEVEDFFTGLTLGNWCADHLAGGIADVESDMLVRKAAG